MQLGVEPAKHLPGWRLAMLCTLISFAAACAERSPVVTAAPPPPAAALRGSVPLNVQTGLASFYGPGFQGKLTASGIPFDRRQPVAAHPRFPFGTRVRVTNLSNGRQLTVTIVDRGPAQQYVREGVIIDLSQGAAASLGFIRKGRQRVRLEVLEWGDGSV